MNKKILALLLGFFFSFTLGAKEKIPGQIVYNHKTVDVTFLFPAAVLSGSYQFIQNKVNYIDANGKTKVVKPKEAKEIRFTLKGVEVRMVSLTNPYYSSKQIFLKLEADGYLKLYSYSVSNSGSSGVSSVQKNHFFQKGNEKIFQATYRKFKKKLKSYFSDCPDLVKKIDSGELTRTHFREITEYYNNSCR